MWSGCIWFKFYEVLTRKNVIIITEENNLKFINNIGLTGFSRNNAQRAVDEAVKRYGNDAKIVIIPYGKWTIPILK
jgi:nickel-dependent lactate racemase